MANTLKIGMIKGGGNATMWSFTIEELTDAVVTQSYYIVCAQESFTCFYNVGTTNFAYLKLGEYTYNIYEQNFSEFYINNELNNFGNLMATIIDTMLGN